MKQEIKDRIEKIKKGIVPSGYKKTPVGICPIEWGENKLGSISNFVGGGTPSTKKVEFWQGNIPWISSSDLYDNKINRIKITRYITTNAISNSPTKLIPSGSILVVTRVGVGKVAVNENPVCTSQDFTNLINLKVNKNFLAYFLYYSINKKLNTLQGTSIKGITTKELANMFVLDCKLQEQEKIAEILTVWDNAVELQEKHIDKLLEQKKALMQKLLTSQPEWQEYKLGDLCDKIYQPETVAQSNFTEKGFKVYGANGHVGYLNKYNHEKWQVVLSCRGDCGTINKTEEKSWINGNAMVLNIDKKTNLDKMYFYYQCLATSFKDVIDNSGIPQITRSPLENKKIKIISDINIQKKLAKILFTKDNQIEFEKQLLEKYKEQRKALMQMLLTGIVRVVI